MENKSFVNILDSELPIICNDISLNKVTGKSLLSLKRKCVNQEQEIMTCRPIIIRTEEESLELFEKLLNNENNLLLGIYKYVEKGSEIKEIIGRGSLYDYNFRNRSIE